MKNSFSLTSGWFCVFYCIFSVALLLVCFSARADFENSLPTRHQNTPAPTNPSQETLPHNTQPVPTTTEPAPTTTTPKNSHESPKNSSKSKTSWGTHNTNAPVQFRADQASGSRQEGIVRLSGHAVIIQDHTTLESDEALLKGDEGSDLLLGNSTRGVQEAIAMGNVRILKKNPAGIGPHIRASGDKATLNMQERTLTLEGNAKIWQGQEYIHAQTIRMNLATGDITLTQPQGTVDPKTRSQERSSF